MNYPESTARSRLEVTVVSGSLLTVMKHALSRVLPGLVVIASLGVTGCTLDEPRVPSPSTSYSATQPRPTAPLIVGQWDEIAESPLHPQSVDPQVVWVGDSFLVIDLWNVDMAWTGVSARFFPSTRTWTHAVDLPMQDLRLGGDDGIDGAWKGAAVAILDGRVYFNLVEKRAPLLVYDLSSNQWSTVSLPKEAGERQECVQRVGGVLVVCTTSGDGVRRYFTYRPGADVWSRAPDSPQADTDAVYQNFVGNGNLVEFSSKVVDGEDVHRYVSLDLRTNTWSDIPIPAYWTHDITSSGEAVVFDDEGSLGAKPTAIAVWDWDSGAPRVVTPAWNEPGSPLSDHVIRILDPEPDCDPGCALGTNLIDVRNNRGLYLPAAGYLNEDRSTRLTETGPAVGDGVALEYDDFTWYLTTFG